MNRIFNDCMQPLLKWALLSCFLMHGFAALAQDWVEIKIDDAVTVQLPPDFEQGDTIVQFDQGIKATIKTLTWAAYTEHGIIHVTKTIGPPEMRNNMRMNAESDLIDYYRGVENGFVKAGIEILEQEYLHWDSLLAQRLRLSLSDGENTMFIESRTVFFDYNTYQFQYSMKAVDAARQEVQAEIKRLMDEIQLAPGLDASNQYGKSKPMAGRMNWTILVGMVVGAGLLALVIVLWVRGSSRANSPNYFQG